MPRPEASTPRVLDEETGPTFRVQDESARDRAAEKLAKGAMQKQRESRQNSKKERDLDVGGLKAMVVKCLEEEIRGASFRNVQNSNSLGYSNEVR